MVKKEKKPDGPTWIEETQTVDNLLWIVGTGKLPCKTMYVAERPCESDVRNKSVFTGPAGSLFFAEARNAGVDTDDAWVTNAIKYPTPGNRASNAGDLKMCNPMLMEEIVRAKPEIIVCMGAPAVKAVMGRTYKLADYRGEVVPFPGDPSIKVFAIYNPSMVARSPDVSDTFRQDLRKLAAVQQGVDNVHDETEFEVVQTADRLSEIVAQLWSESDRLFLSIDAEWHARTWMHPDSYIRLFQFSNEVGKAVVVEFHDENGPVMDKPEEAWAILKTLLEDPRVGLMGHNVISDGEMLLALQQIDIRERVVYDPMLAEHVINETGPFSLTECTVKYTNMGRYDTKVVQWRDTHKKETKYGYGLIPRDIFNTYAAKDVDAPLRIMLKQLQLLQPFKQPRGDYPSLWDITLATQRSLYEIERTGLRIDQERLEDMIQRYRVKKQNLMTQLKIMAAQQGLPDFKHGSVVQVRTLLFDKLELTPIKTTKGKPWGEYMRNACNNGVQVHQPSTDKTTLEILEEKHPAVKVLAQLRKVDQACKVWLRHAGEDDDENSKGGGIPAKIWLDGRMHSHFSQLSDTGRFRTNKPNCQNWPKRAEGYMEQIFGSKEATPPLLRTVVVPSDGYYFMEADYKQAELFVLASLSEDPTMWSALTTPGKDMHDMTAITAFGLVLQDESGNMVSEKYLLDLAARDMDKFKAVQKELFYLDQKGRRLTRGEFKDGIRVSAKNLALFT